MNDASESGTFESIDPSSAQFAALRDGDDGLPVIMINLLRFRAQAAYPEGSPEAATPTDGRTTYDRYAKTVGRLVAEGGGEIVAYGALAPAFIAPANERWDDALIVRYPSRTAFLTMVASPVYRAALPHRRAGLEATLLLPLPVEPARPAAASDASGAAASDARRR